MTIIMTNQSSLNQSVLTFCEIVLLKLFYLWISFYIKNNHPLNFEKQKVELMEFWSKIHEAEHTTV